MSFLQAEHRLGSSVCDFKITDLQKRTEAEMKLLRYRRSHFLLKKDYIILLFIKLIATIVLLIIAAILCSYLLQQSENHKDFYEFRRKIQNQYLLTDLKSANSFFMLFIPISLYVKFPNNQSIAEFETVWEQIFMEEITNLKTRSYEISSDLYDSHYAMMLYFNPDN